MIYSHAEPQRTQNWRVAAPSPPPGCIIAHRWTRIVTDYCESFLPRCHPEASTSKARAKIGEILKSVDNFVAFACSTRGVRLLLVDKNKNKISDNQCHQWAKIPAMQGISIETTLATRSYVQLVRRLKL